LWLLLATLIYFTLSLYA